MSATTVRLRGAQAFDASLKRYGRAVTRRVAQAVAAHALAVDRTAKHLAPVDTGFLRRNIRADVAAVLTDLRATVVSGASYSSFVEFGTSRMAARPFLFPAAESERRAFYASLRAAVRGAR